MRGAPRAQLPRTRVIPVLAICVALCAAARADDADLGREVYDDFSYSGFEFPERVRIKLRPVLRRDVLSDVENAIDVNVVLTQH